MKLRGSLQNRISENGVYSDGAVAVGMGATITMYTDRHAATVVANDGKIVTIQQDQAIGLKKNLEYGEQQDYKFERDLKGRLHYYRAKKFSGTKLVKYQTLSFTNKTTNETIDVDDISSVTFGNSTRFNETTEFWKDHSYETREDFVMDHTWNGVVGKYEKVVEVNGVTYDPVYKNENGRWVKGGTGGYFGGRSEYYDYSF